MCEPGYVGDGCSKSQAWPLRCSTRRHGLDASTSCKRGASVYRKVLTPGNQVVQIKFNDYLDPEDSHTAVAPAPFVGGWR